MDIYGVKKYILELEQVFLEYDLGISKTHVYKSTQLIEQVFL